MDLYDDLDTKQRPDGWSQSYQMLQTQLALKKATAKPPIQRAPQKRVSMLTPVMALKSKKDDVDIFKPALKSHSTTIISTPSNKVFNEYDWNVVDEYDPIWPNEYEKLVKEKRDKESEKSRGRSSRKSSNMRFENDSPPTKFSSGFGGRPNDDEETMYGNRSPPSGSQSRSGGAAIAPPPSLQDSTPILPTMAFTSNSEKLSTNNVTGGYGSGSVAAKIMAKYGFKDGQGLGKQEQGMSIALQVEKTSKRGGRIIHEKELMLPPAVPSPPPQVTQIKELPTITEIMKAPSKVVLLRNMVGPGDVDNDLEPEVKDECNTKYGEVVSVVINELRNVEPEEAVRIFVEFKRIESATKAVVDLNGRFFGGRQVRAGFFSYDKYKAFQLYD